MGDIFDSCPELVDCISATWLNLPGLLCCIKYKLGAILKLYAPFTGKYCIPEVNDVLLKFSSQVSILELEAAMLLNQLSDGDPCQSIGLLYACSKGRIWLPTVQIKLGVNCLFGRLSTAARCAKPLGVLPPCGLVPPVIFEVNLIYGGVMCKTVP
ncbi:hypothetical protein QAD02_014885 [Eretmocerus hayati]|uniref:Uncharacterized protein n=1 Tax=Eretmocerus hayati TaxID=131215 RepID=A0ACC2P7N5_9HYME|nr:hypothetical protein QAD02_014885 [Eretmocerus hayati]